MAKYRKKPVVIDAVQYEKGMEDGFVEVYLNDESVKGQMRPYIETLEGRLTFNEDDYIITGVKGERYAVRKDIFEETYDLADEQEIKKDLNRRKEILFKYVEDNFNDEQKRVFNLFVEAIDSDEERVLLLNPNFENGVKDKIEVLITLNALYEGYEHKGDLFAIEKIIGEDY